MRLFISCTALLAVMILTVGPGADRLQAAKPTQNKPLKVVFADGGTDNIRSDGLGVYQDGVNRVVAYINAAFNGSLTFATNTFDTGGRQLGFFFDSCLLNPPDYCNFPFPSGNAVAQIQAAPRDANGSPITNGLLGMAVGEKLRAFAQIQVKGQPEEWTLCMKPENSGFCALSENATYARIERVRVDGWEFFATAEPDAIGGRSDVADLLKTTTIRGKKTVSVEGNYSMPFRITVTCVNAASCS